MRRYVRPKSQIHNGNFEDLRMTTSEGYFKSGFGSVAEKEKLKVIMRSKLRYIQRPENVQVH